LINSSTCHELLRKSTRPIKWLLVGIGFACFVGPALAGDSASISQYVREYWGQNKGFPIGSVYAIAQTNDGFLWIGTEKGLLRFDGSSFVPIQTPYSQDGVPTPVFGLASDDSGGLWIRMSRARLLRYQNGAFDERAKNLNPTESVWTAMSRGEGGDPLFSGFTNGIVKYQNGSFVKLGAVQSTLDFVVLSMAAAPGGAIWLGTRDLGIFRLAAGQISTSPILLRNRKINCLLESANVELWIGTDDGLARWGAGTFLATGLPPSLEHVQVLALANDRDSNVWVGTAEGLVRIGPGGDYSLQENAKNQNTVTAIFEDREGNIWAGGDRGLEKLRRAAFTTYSVNDGMPSDHAGPVYADAENRIWFATPDGGLFWLKDNSIHHVPADGLDKDIVYSISGGEDGLWLGRQTGGLTHLRTEGGAFAPQTYTETNGLAQNSVYSVLKTSDGSVWAGTLSAGLSRYKDGEFSTYTNASGLPLNTVTSIAETSDRTVWFGTPNGVAVFADGQWRAYANDQGLPDGNVTCLASGSGGVVWVGTSKGLAFIQSGIAHYLRDVPDLLREPILGIQEDKAGWLWIESANRVLRVNRSELLAENLGDDGIREYGLADGLRSTEGVERSRSVILDPAGRIWFSTNGGLSVVDPRRASAGSAPAIVHIEAISADGRAFGIANSVSVPAPHQRVTIRYSGLSLSVPERVRYRFRLDGFDHDWSEPVASQEATYTNLGAGPYRFHVIASNSEGLWNGSEAVVQFAIEPAFWQTWWFQLACALAVGMCVVAYLRLRTLRLTQQLNMRFEERLAERTRIAQELHDTLLQGFLSASMQLHVADDYLTQDSPAKPLVQRVLELMGRVIEEGRTAVGALRSPASNSLDLEQAFSRVKQEFATQENLDFRVIAEGAPRPLHPVIRDEIYRIGREALINAFRHSRASTIEVELEYASDEFRVLVRDNGIGINPEVLRAGRDGHWGLSGMRERAKKIGARVRVLSSTTAGTEVELSVPSHTAFER